MLKRSLVLGAALGAVSISLGARDLFIRPDAFFVAPRTRVVLPVLNRIFSTTENAVAPRERYAKFVKALVQVGTQRSGMAPSWGTRPRS